MKISDQEVQAYVDGELAADDAARVEAAIAEDVLVAARVEREKRLRAQVRGAFDPVLAEPVPSRLAGLLNAPAEQGAPVSNVSPLGERRGARDVRWRRPVLALAASVAALSIAAWLHAPPGDLSVQDGVIVARGALAHGLDTGLASAPSARADVNVGLTFRDAGGRLCRTFTEEARGLAGLACREDGRWALPVLSRGNAAPAGEVRQAATAMPAEIQAAVDARMQGEAFDAAQERAAQAQGWR